MNKALQSEFFKIENNIKLPFNDDTILSIKNFPKSENLYYFFSKNYFLYLWDLENNAVTKLFEKNFSRFNDVYIDYSFNIYFLDEHQITISDTSLKIIDTINLWSENYNYSASALFPFYVKDTLAFAFKYPNYIINSLDNYKKFISEKREFCFDLKNKKEVIFNMNFEEYPSDLSNHFKYVFNPFRILDDNNNLIYSFEHNDTIEIFNLSSKTKNKRVIRSNYFIQNSHFNFNDVQNFEKVSQYLIENSRYYCLYYDKYKKLYYRIIRHKYPYKNKDKINLITDADWSIVVCDENFNVLYEVLFESGRYYFNKIIITKKGVLIKNQNDEEIYSLFDFSRH
ncbi:MAG TPA: DUF4221 family protein [Bacteroidia bacterium]|nr:DUF4221 family protein [Bacteroidia bacterium]